MINILVRSVISLILGFASFGFELSQSWSAPWRGAGKSDGSGFKWAKIDQEVTNAVVVSGGPVIQGWKSSPRGGSPHNMRECPS